MFTEMKLDNELPVSGNGSRYKRQCRTASGDAGIKSVLQELLAFVPETLKAIAEKKQSSKVTESAACSCMFAHGLTPNFESVNGVFTRSANNGHVAYMRDTHGIDIARVSKATKGLIAALKSVGHYGACNGIVKEGMPVFYVSDVRALVKAPKTAMPETPKTAMPETPKAKTAKGKK